MLGCERCRTDTEAVGSITGEGKKSSSVDDDNKLR
jgi:hypothetical protein